MRSWFSAVWQTRQQNHKIWDQSAAVGWEPMNREVQGGCVIVS